MTSLRLLTFALPCFVAVAVAAGGGIAVRSLVAADEPRALAEGSRQAEVTARTLGALRDLPRVAETLVGDQLAAQAAIADQLVAVTDGVKGESVNNRLTAATASGNPLGILVTDSTGRVLFRHKPTPDVTFAADGTPAPHGRAIGALIGGAPSPAVSPVERQAAGGLIVKQAAIRGNRGRLVQVTADVSGLATIAMAAGGSRVIDDLLATKSAEAVWLIGQDGRIVAHGDAKATPTPANGVPPDAVRDAARAAIDARAPAAFSDAEGIVAAAPLKGESSPYSAVVIRRGAETGLPMAWTLVFVGLAAVLAGILTFLALWAVGRRADTPLTALAGAAKAVSAGRFNPFTLNDLYGRGDAAGDAARAFRDMARDVSAREDGLEVKLLLAGQTPPK